MNALTYQLGHSCPRPGDRIGPFPLPHMRQAERCIFLREMSRPLNDIQQAPKLTIVTSFHPESEALTPQSLSPGLMTRAASCHDCGRVPQWSDAWLKASSGGARNLGHLRSWSHTAPEGAPRPRRWEGPSPDATFYRLEAPKFGKGSLANRDVRLDNNRGDVCRT
jgi:hypothetical protein